MNVSNMSVSNMNESNMNESNMNVSNMNVSNKLYNILYETHITKQKIFSKNSEITNVTLTNSNIHSFETMNNVMANNIQLLNKRVDFLILKLIHLFIFLFRDKYENKVEYFTINNTC